MIILSCGHVFHLDCMANQEKNKRQKIGLSRVRCATDIPPLPNSVRLG